MAVLCWHETLTANILVDTKDRNTHKCYLGCRSRLPLLTPRTSRTWGLILTGVLAALQLIPYFIPLKFPKEHISFFGNLLKDYRNQDGSVDIENKLRAGLRNRGFHPRYGVIDFCLQHSVQTCSGVRLSSFPMGTGAHSPRIKRLGRKSD
jgi:hypothetical protein